MRVDLPRYIGHRGAAAQAPENTLAGIRKAHELGLAWVEFDVRLTRDARLVLFHDDTLERTTDGTGPVAAASLAEIRRLDAGGWFHSDFQGEPVPLLEEALALLGDLEMGANIEVKAGGPDAEDAGARLGALLAETRPAVPLLLSSFLPAALAPLLRTAPDLPRGLLLPRWKTGWRKEFEAMGCSTLHLGEVGLTAQQVRAVKRTGVPLVVYTVNSRRRADNLLAAGVDAVITDAPRRMTGLSGAGRAGSAGE